MNLIWPCAGVLVGLLNALTMSAAVRRLTPAAPVTGLCRIAGGMLVRWALVAVLLAVSLRQSAGAGLAAFAGLWLARWVAIAWWSRDPRDSCPNKFGEPGRTGW